MQDNNTVEVMIGGRVYNLSGYEDVSYLQKVAAYINGRDQELMKQTGYAKQKPDMQNVLLQLTLADDYFKCNRELENIKRKYHDQEKEMYRLKHELVSMKMFVCIKNVNFWHRRVLLYLLKPRSMPAPMRYIWAVPLFRPGHTRTTHPLMNTFRRLILRI